MQATRSSPARAALASLAAAAAAALLAVPLAAAHGNGPMQVPIPPLPTPPAVPCPPPGLDVPGEVPMACVGPVELGGIRNARIFDHQTNAWTQVEHMEFARWYPTSVILPDGKVLVGGGTRKSQHPDQPSHARLTETFDPATNQFTTNNTGPASQSSMPLYPRLWLMPNGKVFYDGSGQTWAPGGAAVDHTTWGIQSFFNLQTKQWEISGPSSTGLARGVPTAVMLPMHPPYDKASILQAGGVIGVSPDITVALPVSETITVDKAGKVTHEKTGNLNRGRWASIGVTLPDGTVAAFNGSDREETTAPGHEIAIREIELFDPKTRQWTVGPRTHRDRTYHNTAMLLPDGRVLVGGHAPAPNKLSWQHDNPGAASNDRDASFEIYSPGYMFRGRRATIVKAQSAIAWGSTFTIEVGNIKGAIDSVVLSRLPAQTHTYDANQRTLFLEFAQGPTRQGRGRFLTVKAPPDGIAAPPGPYYLFVNRKSDLGPVPSVARIVTLAARVTAAATREQAAQPFRAATAVPEGNAYPDLNTQSMLPGQCPWCQPASSASRTVARAEKRAPLEVRKVIGEVSQPFDEGGAAQPLCRRQADGYLICKPVGQTVIALPDGRVLYWDGFPGTENSRFFLLDGGEQTHNAESRIMDLRSGTPSWSTPSPVDGGAVNPDIAAGTAPNDARNNDGDIFCSYQVHLADGRVLVMGGTDWYSDPGVSAVPTHPVG